MASFFVYLIYKSRIIIYSNLINIHGNIEIEEGLNKGFKPNSVLYIILKNEKGNTFAIKEYINPVFPLKFKITKKNVLFPDLTTFKTNIYATLNYHGEIGSLKKGDLISDNLNINIFSRNANIKIDKIKQ